MEAVIFIGIQGSGMSTFYQERFFRTHLRLGLDLLKIRHWERLLRSACLEAKRPFVVDNTNPLRPDRARYIAPARAAGFSVVGYFFEPHVERALVRNAQRNGWERVPVAGLLGTLRRLEVPTFDEGFTALYRVDSSVEGQFTVRDWAEVRSQP